MNGNCIPHVLPVSYENKLHPILITTLIITTVAANAN